MPLAAGAIFANVFEIIRPLGCGSSGTVYKARHLGLDKMVALKVLRPTDKKSLARFHREAQILADLSHNNICQCFLFGIDGSVPYMALEFIEAPTLRWIVAQRHLDWEETAEIAIQICAGLKAAHDRGVIHRDVKPENIMVMADGTVKILDFGLSSFSSSENQKLTQNHVTMGTPPYMSPEQFEDSKVDQRADIYSVGCIMFECIAGNPPLLSETGWNFTRGQRSFLPGQSEEFATVPANFELIVRKALEQDRRRRYKSAAEMAEDLSALIADPGSSKPLSNSDFGSIARWVSPTCLILAVICGFGMCWQFPSSKTTRNDDRGIKNSLNEISRLYDLPGQKSKKEAAELLTTCLSDEEHLLHPDRRQLFEGYMLSERILSPAIAEGYLKKAVEIGRKQGDAQLMFALWSYSRSRIKQGEPANDSLREMLSVATNLESDKFISLGNWALCKEYVKEGRFADAEKFGIAFAAHHPNPADKEMTAFYYDDIAMLLGIDTKSARKTADQVLSTVNPAEDGTIMQDSVLLALQAKTPAAFLRFVNGTKRLHEKNGVFPAKSQQGLLAATAANMRCADPALKILICQGLVPLLQGDEALVVLHAKALCLLQLDQITQAVATMKECQSRFGGCRDWPLYFQSYLDLLVGAVAKNQPEKLKELLPAYDANLHRLRDAYGVNSERYAMAIWERAELNRRLHNREAALRDLDDCEAIVSKIKSNELTIERIRKQKAFISAEHG